MKQLKFIGKVIVYLLQTFISILGGTLAILLIMSAFNHGKVTITSDPICKLVIVIGATLGIGIDYIYQKLNKINN